MPGKPARKMYQKKRRYVKKYRKQGNILVNKGPSFGANSIPEEMYVKVKYCTDSLTLTGTASTPATYIMRGNDIFDPDYTGVGHQPYLSDQLCSLYSRWVVNASKIRVRATCASTNDIKMLVRPSLYNTTVSSYELEVERPDNKNCVFSSEQACSIQHYAKTKIVQGVPRLDDIIYHGDAGPSGPTAGPTGSGPWYWVVVCEGIRSGDAWTAYLQIEVVYYVKLFKRAIQSQS